MPNWYDVSDQDCGQLNVKVEATNPARYRGGEGYSASGAFHFYSKVGSKLTPEQTNPGVYVITVKGNADTCNRFRIAWKAVK